MKIILPFLAVAWAIPHPITLEEEWNQYKESFGKFYTSEVEDIKRLNAYLATKQSVDQHNRKYERGETSFMMTINEFADWFPNELSKMNGLKVDENDLSTERTVLELPSGVKVPEEIDWIKKGAVTSVKNQGNCGSCYAFSAVGALEGLMFITNKTITSLSAQELVDCSTANDNSGCEGGFMTSCFSYVIHRKGISTDKSYPYIAREEECKADKGQIGAYCSSYVTLKQTEDALKEAVGTISPVAIGFAVNNEFFAYKEGIYDGDCGPNVNHGMLAVGYGADSKTGIDYWLVKNSWGEKWGINGYVKILRGVNKCNINLYNSYPVYK